MRSSAGFRDRLVARLRYLIELRGKSVAQVEKELGRSRGFLADALRGGKRLPLETLLEVLELLKIDPGRFFTDAARTDRRWGDRRSPRPTPGGIGGAPGDDPLRRIADDLGSGTIEVEQVARALRAVVRLLDEKGYLSRDELGSALRAGVERS